MDALAKAPRNELHKCRERPDDVARVRRRRREERPRYLRRRSSATLPRVVRLAPLSPSERRRHAETRAQRPSKQANTVTRGAPGPRSRGSARPAPLPRDPERLRIDPRAAPCLSRIALAKRISELRTR